MNRNPHCQSNIRMLEKRISIWYDVNSIKTIDVKRNNSQLCWQMKDVAYIWDVEMSQLNFITQLIQGENLTEISVLLVVDLVQPHAMWNIFYQMEKFHDKMKHDTCTKVNYGIIGMKYDLYEVSKRFLFIIIV